MDGPNVPVPQGLAVLAGIVVALYAINLFAWGLHAVLSIF
jgi:hypothetical protein